MNDHTATWPPHTATNTIALVPSDGRDDPSPQNSTHNEAGTLANITRQALVDITRIIGIDPTSPAINEAIDATVSLTCLYVVTGLSGADNENHYYGGEQ